MKVLKTLINIQYECGMQSVWFTASTITPKRHLGSATPKFSKIWPPPAQVLHCKGAPICPSKAYEDSQTHIYIKHGSGMQAVSLVYCLNHDTTTSFGLCLTQISQNLAPTCTDNCVRVCQYAQPQHKKVLKLIIYIQYGCGMQSAVVYSLNHDTTISFRLHQTSISHILAPTCTGITV